MNDLRLYIQPENQRFNRVDEPNEPNPPQPEQPQPLQPASTFIAEDTLEKRANVRAAAGTVGGRSRSDKKRASSAANLAIARKKRWNKVVLETPDGGRS